MKYLSIVVFHFVTFHARYTATFMEVIIPNAFSPILRVFQNVNIVFSFNNYNNNAYINIPEQ